MLVRQPDAKSKSISPREGTNNDARAPWVLLSLFLHVGACVSVFRQKRDQNPRGVSKWVWCVADWQLAVYCTCQTGKGSLSCLRGKEQLKDELRPEQVQMMIGEHNAECTWDQTHGRGRLWPRCENRLSKGRNHCRTAHLQWVAFALGLNPRTFFSVRKMCSK